ncbi:hypothetical protein DDB_G0272474 [Dictyostelium discoideum AX4]|uniref:Uncharacterized protein n=1 Tax=Dictyostelium discoideum TaxID=44689 RepID=Q559M0_DICDI|nr:hypothetical protein DDB_G0272474 [Dictyostelium discoideum AX4]EAL71389.1 hypothetical protein DDB_G0272474 [Dictyostelium discoideum AX4]|eukprot:XP_645314.1 hypothetical protein DDB_G0272474 [Dictyostelium discoideum AX4]
MTSQKIILPLYIQKIIIKILCKFINNNNKVLDTLGFKNYRDSEKAIKKLMINLALVSHSWFNTFSNNLNVSIDFNYGNSEYSIIKKENVKTLKLHYDHDKHHFYNKNINKKDNKKYEVEIPIGEVLEKLKILKSSSNSSFQNLIIRNIGNSIESIPKLLNPIQTFGTTTTINNNFNEQQIIEKISLLEYKIDQDLAIETLKELETFNVKKLFCITTSGSFKILEDFFKIYARNLKQFLFLKFDNMPNYISQLNEDGSDTNELLPCFKTLFSLNKCKSIVFYGNLFISQCKNNNHLNIYGMQIRLKDIENLLDFKKNDYFESLSLTICFYNLSFFLTPTSIISQSLLSPPQTSPKFSKFSKSSSSSSPEPQISRLFKKCPCGQSQNEDDFKMNWNSLIECLKINTKNLKHLDLSHECKHSLLNPYLNYPIQFYSGIAKILNSIPLLESFSSYCFPSPSTLINELFSAPTSFLETNETIKLGEKLKKPVCSITKFTFFIHKDYYTDAQLTETIQSTSYSLQRHQSITNLKLYLTSSNNYKKNLIFKFEK